MATAKGKITASNMVPGTVVRIIMESDATAELFERKPEWMAARIKRDSTLAEIVENIPMGNGRRKIVTKFGEFVVVGHQTFILAKDGEKADEPEAVEATIETVEEDLTEIAEVLKEIRPLPAERFTISEEQIEENMRERDADAIRADQEMREAAERERLIQEARDGITAALDAITALSLPEVELTKAEEQITVSREMLDGPEPWEAKRHAKRTAEMWAHVVRLRAEFETAPCWRRERITAALAAYGTVVYPEGTPEYDAYREALTEALDEFKNGPKRYRVTFERVGAYRNVPAFEYSGDETPESVEARLTAFLRPYLISRFFSFHFEGSRLLIEAGRWGSGIVSEIERS